VIPAQLADVIRYADALLCLALVVASGWSAVLAEHWDQRTRFAIFAAFGFLLTGSHLAALGQDGNWRLVMLVVVVAIALGSTSVNIRREVREREARGRGTGRSVQ
jgi:uncharacterized membrane protein